MNHDCYDCKLIFLEAAPPIVNELTLPDNNDPVILRWSKPGLTYDNREFFQGYDVSFSHNVLQTTLYQRGKRNTLASETNITRLGPDATSHTFSILCPYNDSVTLCPYSQYCFSVASVFEYRGIPIDVSGSTLTTMCDTTDEAGEFSIFLDFLCFDMLYG